MKREGTWKLLGWNESNKDGLSNRGKWKYGLGRKEGKEEGKC